MKPRVLNVGQTLERSDFLTLLGSLNYKKKKFVTEPGDFSFRGSTVDIYPVTYRAPVRLEFEMDTLVSIRDFSLTDGKSLAKYDELFLLQLTTTFEKKAHQLRDRFESYEALTEKSDLKYGDYVVHMKYGIAKFLGLKTFQMKGEKKKHIALEFAKKEILYIDAKEPLEKYIGGEGYAPKLTKLNSKEWVRIKERTKRALKNVASDLLELQAKRSFGRDFEYRDDQSWQEDFEKEFPYRETRDQVKAVKEVKDDMSSDKLMDRLLCGDVGYGKTEIAMRAAFKAVTGGRQVAILVPTTVLAEQHYSVLKERVKNFPVTVEVLSRFRSKKEQQNIVAALKRGMADIVVGTHRLLSKDVTFKKLGLVIIDEEQRFGVRHKEKLKNMRSLVDILTLTATPIPRTLYMSMMGVRDMSLINTPPKTRMPIETYIMQYDDQRVKEGIEREIARGGQVYFIHNRVQSIEKIYKSLKELMPNVRFAVGHGQMRPAALERIMKNFIDREIDCLIATSIVESGIDIPNVNTIFVNRADHFGLSDLYQLRGRVGRYQGKRQAYAYFMVPKNWAFSRDAEKRLSAIEKFTDLGSGFKIALEDLEIRGAGNLLGHEQSGFIHAVGFDMYCRLLRQAIDEQKSESAITGKFVVK